MKDTVIEIGGRQLPLVFDMAAWAEIEEDIVSPIQGLAELLNGSGRVRTVCRLCAILAEGGRRKHPGEEEITVEWLMRLAKPGQLDELIRACMDAIAKGMRSDVSENDEDEETDAVLAEINKKKEAGS